MVAKIEGFLSRDDLGMRTPDSRSTNITPQHGGVAVHWGGPRQTIDSHLDCIKTWLSWQRYHMDTHGWVDIAYSFGFCNHGFVFAGRGLDVRTAANGTNDGNQNWYAAVWIGGSGNAITRLALDALEWIVLTAREDGAGSGVVPHRTFTGSECPGALLLAHALLLDKEPISTGTTTPVTTPEEDEVKIKHGDEGNDVVAIQRAVVNWLKSRNTEVTDTHSGDVRIPHINGTYTAYTRDAVEAFQKAANLDRRDGIVLGVCDPTTLSFLLRYDA